MSQSPDDKSGEAPHPWKVDTRPIPLDTLAVSPDGKGECWYRIPSWRVHFDHDALRDEDIRLHRAIGSHAAWTLTEASTGLKLHSDLPHEFYIGNEGAMLAEFASGRMLQLTPEKMRDAMTKGKEMLSKRTPNPFAVSHVRPTTGKTPRTDALAAKWADVPDGSTSDALTEYLNLCRALEVDLSEAQDLLATVERALKVSEQRWSDWKSISPSATAPSQNRVDAEEACIDIFHDFDGWEVKNEPRSVQIAWEVGQALAPRTTDGGNEHG